MNTIYPNIKPSMIICYSKESPKSENRKLKLGMVTEVISCKVISCTILNYMSDNICRIKIGIDNEKPT